MTQNITISADTDFLINNQLIFINLNEYTSVI